MILRVILKICVCTLGGVLVSWCVIGGVVSLFFSTKIMPRYEFVMEHYSDYGTHAKISEGSLRQATRKWEALTRAERKRIVQAAKTKPLAEPLTYCTICDHRIIERWRIPDAINPLKNESDINPLTEQEYQEMLDIVYGKGTKTTLPNGMKSDIVRVKYQPDWGEHIRGFVMVVGILCGIVWAIEREKARRCFGLWTGAGVLCSGVTGLFGSVIWQFGVCGLFVGIVSALVSVGAFRKK